MNEDTTVTVYFTHSPKSYTTHVLTGALTQHIT